MDNIKWVESAINLLLIEGEGRLFSRISKVSDEINIADTKAIGYSYFVALDGNGRPRTKDMIEYVAAKLVDYSIPKKLQDEAREHLNRTGSTSKILELQKKAKVLFTDLSKTGEFGEMLLYTLVQEILGYPQLISKMSLKTSGQLHYQGADGVHVGFDEETDSLSLYWGESKMEKTLSSALRNCFSSIKGFLIDTHGHDSTQSRDLQLITSNLSENVNDPRLEALLVRYFDLDDELSNKLIYKGICFVGFDSTNYPANPNEKTLDILKGEFVPQVSRWTDGGGKQIKTHVGLDSFELHVFFMPFPSVQNLRDEFLKHIKE